MLDYFPHNMSILTKHILLFWLKYVYFVDQKETKPFELYSFIATISTNLMYILLDLPLTNTHKSTYRS